jgi:HD superfamily phosphodiesterase
MIVANEIEQLNRVKNNIIEEAKRFYSTLDEWHDVSHGERVVKWALKIQEKEASEKLVVEVGAWLHQYHDHLDQLVIVLNQNNLSKSLNDKLYSIVELCRPNKIEQATSIEAKIVFDADALELMGSYGIIREVLCNYKIRNQSWQEALKNAQNVQELFYQKLKTQTAISIANDLQSTAREFWKDLDKLLLLNS